MNLLMTGSSGLIGRSLIPILTAGGHRVERLARAWTEIPPGIDGVVHLAGEPLTGRWDAGKKKRILESRRDGTRRLCEALARMPVRPRVLVSASAVGVYGDRGDEVLTEESPAGSGFLAEVCRAWEKACDPARERGIRVVHLRMGVVLTTAGGALSKMLLPFRLGVGGRLGDGAQRLSWIAIDDVMGIFAHAIANDSLEGPVNAVAPQSVTNREFTRILARVLGRPAVFRIPAFAMRWAFGEAADAMLLTGQRVEPARLRASGYVWRYPDLEMALRHLLGRTAPDPAIR
jgi:hypothetical protein